MGDDIAYICIMRVNRFALYIHVFFKLSGFCFLLIITGITSRVSAQSPTWAEDVAPILYSNCTGCHFQGGIAPVSFVGFTQAKNYSYSIKSAVEKRSMPPWPADPNYRRYAHERLLSSEEIQTISDWVDAGSPQGDLNNAPPDPTPKTETSIVNPDLKLKMPDYTVKTTTDEYRCFVIPTNLSANKYLTEIEVVPGNLTVVHHVLVFHDTSSIPMQLDNNDPKPGYLGFGGTGSGSSKLIGVWVPGQDPFKMPPGMGILLEKGGYIILQVHYPPLVDNVTDSSKVYFKLSSNTLREVAISPALNHVAPSLQNGPLYIPANQVKNFTAKFIMPVDVSIFAVAPHMHLVGTSIKAFGVKTAGDTNKFISIPEWDFHWQRTYVFPKVQKIPQGMVLWANATYDNTTANPYNPNNPPQAVSLGEGTGDEMLLVYFWYTLYAAGDENIIIDPSTPKNISSVLRIDPAADTKLYPNPAGDVFRISRWNGDPGKTLCHIYSTDGRMLNAGEFRSTEEGGLEVSLQGIPSGIYIVKVSDGKSLYVNRVIRE